MFNAPEEESAMFPHLMISSNMNWDPGIYNRMYWDPGICDLNADEDVTSYQDYDYCVYKMSCNQNGECSSSTVAFHNTNCEAQFIDTQEGVDCDDKMDLLLDLIHSETVCDVYNVTKLENIVLEAVLNILKTSAHCTIDVSIKHIFNIDYYQYTQFPFVMLTMLPCWKTVYWKPS